MIVATSAQKRALRESIQAYCEAAVRNEPNIHYSQQRPFRFYDVIGKGFATLDCSGFVCNTFWNAMHDNGLYIHDPLDWRYTGYGNTTTEERYLRAHGKPVTTQGYMVGDIARYGTGNHAHTTVCSRDGDKGTAVFTSHGQEAGPLVCRLDYRHDLIGVWRHPALL